MRLDDDAIGVGFVARLREAGLNLKGFADEHRSFVIDFNTGFIAQPSATGIAVEEIQGQYWTSALGIMINPNAKVGVMNFGHNSVWRWMPTVTMTGEDMVLRGHNDYNEPSGKERLESNADAAG